ncbi:peroxidase-related enzyme [Rummeliibacillus pycnus]|uniref:peroxidase-related enzyme n=1 Tax=Rummeliibacillus pycnus TaxID=101070 RepID=UPI000C999A01|nr:peroxidase-related enzyme [Rummeliibacillus pycnus]
MTKYDQKYSYLEKPNESEIPTELQKEFDATINSQIEQQGFFNHLFKILPLNAQQYKGFLNLKESLFNSETCYLSNVDKEMMGLVVSSTNSCNYCLTTHGDVLRGLTKNPAWVDQLTYNYRSTNLTEKQRALCDYAYRATRNVAELTPEEVDKLRSVGFNDHEILEAAFVVGFFNYTNRWVSTIGAIPNPGHYSHNR